MAFPLLAVVPSNALARPAQLHLTYNKLNVQGVSAIAHVLEVNTAIRTLDLTGNVIRNEGAEALAHMLVSHALLACLCGLTRARLRPATPRSSTSTSRTARSTWRAPRRCSLRSPKTRGWRSL